MYTYELIGGVFAICLIILIVLASKKDKKPDNKIEDTKEKAKPIEKKPESTSTSSGVVFSDSFKPTESTETKEDAHTTKTFLYNLGDDSYWVCPSCETENPNYSNRCCVCYHVK